MQVQALRPIFLQNSPASEETSEAKEGTFSRDACVLLFGVSHWLRGQKNGEK